MDVTVRAPLLTAAFWRSRRSAAIARIVFGVLAADGDDEAANCHYMKASALVEGMTPVAMTFYAQICGWTLARAHARSGDPIAIAEYLSADGTFDYAIADFSARYADQNQRDYDTFVKAVADGRIQAAVTGI